MECMVKRNSNRSWETVAVLKNPDITPDGLVVGAGNQSRFNFSIG